MALRPGKGVPVAAAAAVVAGLFCGCGARVADGTWPLPNGDLAGTRAASGSPIDAGSVARLRVRWRFRFTARPSFSGRFASTPVADRDTVYVQDLQSNVFALERTTGATRWERRFRARNDGPNGLAVDRRRVYGATDADAFALSTSTGKELWQRHLTSRSEQFVDVAPVVWKGLVFVSTVGTCIRAQGDLCPRCRDRHDRWKFVTIKRLAASARAGGGLWYPVSVDASGRLYAGFQSGAVGRTKWPNGAAFRARSGHEFLLVLDAHRPALA